MQRNETGDFCREFYCTPPNGEFVWKTLSELWASIHTFFHQCGSRYSSLSSLLNWRIPVPSIIIKGSKLIICHLDHAFIAIECLPWMCSFFHEWMNCFWFFLLCGYCLTFEQSITNVHQQKQHSSKKCKFHIPKSSIPVRALQYCLLGELWSLAVILMELDLLCDHLFLLSKFTFSLCLYGSTIREKYGFFPVALCDWIRPRSSVWNHYLH